MQVAFDFCNPDDIENMYIEYFPKIYNYVFYKVLHKEISEDLVSDIFIKVISKFYTFDSKKSSFSNWIYRISENTLIDYYRIRKVHYNIDEQINYLHIDFEAQYNQINDEFQKYIYDVLSSLTEKQRTIIYLKYFENMKNSEICKITGINASTISTIHQRTIHQLHKYIDLNTLDNFVI